MRIISALAMVGLILLVLGAYWLPSIVARSRRHPDLVPIVLVNALLGWTVVGWVWAVIRVVSPPPITQLHLETAYSARTAAERTVIPER